MAACELPLGFLFEPTKQQLVGYFLTTKLSGQQLPPFYNHLLIDCDVYSDHPSDIMASTHMMEDDDGLIQGFFFTPLKKTSVNGKRINRFIPGHGTWLEKAGTKNVYDQDGMVIGIDKYYKFNPASGSKGSVLNKDEWTMHEYSLPGNQDLVLCHITNKKDNNKGSRVRKMKMVMEDESLDYDQTCPNNNNKRSRIDDAATSTVPIEDLWNSISFNNAAEDGGVHDDASTTFMEHGYKNHSIEQVAEAAPVIPSAEDLDDLMSSWSSSIDPSAFECFNL